MVVSSTITAIEMFAARQTSISDVGSGTKITRTLAITAIGKIRS